MRLTLIFLFSDLLNVLSEMPNTVTSGTATDTSNVISWSSRPVSIREMMRRATAAVRGGSKLCIFLS